MTNSIYRKAMTSIKNVKVSERAEALYSFFNDNYKVLGLRHIFDQEMMNRTSNRGFEISFTKRVSWNIIENENL
jgi:hypothetical protein